MVEAMKPLAITLFALAGLVAANAGWATPARADCIASWSKSEYRSYSEVQADVRGQFGNVRILKVALCTQGSKSYFQVVVMDEKGVVRTLHMGAQDNNSLLPRSNPVPDSSSLNVVPPPPPPMPALPMPALPQPAK